MRTSAEIQPVAVKGSRLHATRWVIPVLAATWLVSYFAPWLPPGSRTVWLALALWAAPFGPHGLESGSQFVTIAIAFTALTGAASRLAYAIGQRGSSVLRQVGLLATGVPLSILLPEKGAWAYLTVLAATAVFGLRRENRTDRVAQKPTFVWPRLAGESFPMLSAGCFLTMSYQYNAQWLLRGLLIAAGASLVLRAIIPTERAS